jgi:hypothetical protein
MTMESLRSRVFGNDDLHLEQVRGLPEAALIRVPHGPFNVAVSKLEHYAASRYPAGVFGHKAAQEILGMLGHNENSAESKEVIAELNYIVIAAAGIIKETFEPREELLQSGALVTYRRAHFHGAEQGYFTYLPCDENSFPWEDKATLAQFWKSAVEEAEESRKGLEQDRWAEEDFNDLFKGADEQREEGV